MFPQPRRRGRLAPETAPRPALLLTSEVTARVLTREVTGAAWDQAETVAGRRVSGRPAAS